MKFPQFLFSDPCFQELHQKGSTVLPYTGKTLSLSSQPGMVCVEGTPITNEAFINREEHFHHVVLPLVDLLSTEGRYRSLKNHLDLQEIWHFQSFQKFLKSNSYISPDNQDEYSVGLLLYDPLQKEHYLLSDLENHYLKSELYDLKCKIVYSLDNYYEDWQEIVDWKNDPQWRIRVITGAAASPNHEMQQTFLTHFQQLEAMERAEELSLFNKHYSDFEKKHFAFEIKVHENFYHEELYELGILTDDDEWENRKFVIEDTFQDLLFDELISQTEVEYKGCVGSSGGYMVLFIKEPSFAILQKINVLLAAAKETSYQYYQTLASVEHRADELVEKLLSLKEEEPEEAELEKIEKLLKELQPSLETN